MNRFPYASQQQPLLRSTNAAIAMPVYAPVRSRPRHPIISALKSMLGIHRAGPGTDYPICVPTPSGQLVCTGGRSQPDFDVMVGDSGPVHAPRETFGYTYGDLYRR